jgi:hypothetical protein
MAKKKKASKGPPPKVEKWLEEYKQGMHQGRKPTPEHARSIWDTDYIPDDCKPATLKMIADAEARLGVVIPASLKQELLIQNGGPIVECDEYPFEDSALWTNATVDGIEPLKSWMRAKDDNWFESVKDVKDLHLLILIAAHSESQLCLDYRKSGPDGMPAVTYVDVTMNPTEVVIIAKSVDDFLRALIAVRPKDD